MSLTNTVDFKGQAQGVSAALVSNSLTVATGNLLTLLYCNADNANETAWTVSNTGTAITWTKQVETNVASNCKLILWTGIAGATPPTTVTVTATAAGGGSGGLTGSKVLATVVSAGQHATNPVPSGKIFSGTGATSPAQAITPTSVGSDFWMLTGDWSQTNTSAAATNCTLAATVYNETGQQTVALIRPTTQPRTDALSFTIGETDTAGKVSWIAFEVQAAPAGGKSPLDARSVIHPGKGPSNVGRFFQPRRSTDVISTVVDNPMTAVLGTLTLSGLVPTITQGNSVAAPLGSATLSGLVPTLTQGNSLTGPLGSATLSGLVPTLTQGNSLTAPLGTLTLNGLAATFNQPITLTAPLGALTLTNLDASFTQGNALVGPLGSITLNGLTATFSQPITLTAPLGSLTLNGLTPTFTQGNSFTAPLGTLTLAGLTATLGQPVSMTAVLGSLSLVGLVPTITQGNALTAPLGTLSLVNLDATFSQGNSLIAPLGSLTENGLTVTFSQGNSLVVPLGTLTLQGLAPTITSSGATTMQADIGVLELLGLDAAFVQSITAVPSTAPSGGTSRRHTTEQDFAPRTNPALDARDMQDLTDIHQLFREFRRTRQ